VTRSRVWEGSAAQVEGIGEVLVDLFRGRVTGEGMAVLFDIAFHGGGAGAGREGALGEGGRTEAVHAA